MNGPGKPGPLLFPGRTPASAEMGAARLAREQGCMIVPFMA